MCSYEFREVTPSKYFLNNIQLENVTFYKDLGIIFENNLLYKIYILYTYIIYVFYYEYGCSIGAAYCYSSAIVRGAPYAGCVCCRDTMQVRHAACFTYTLRLQYTIVY